MRGLLLVLVGLAGCRAAAPVSMAPPYDWRKDGDLRQAEADARCGQALPDCARPLALYTLPPSPCAHQGAACTEVISRNAGTWTCGCDACASQADCKPTEHCGMAAGDPCSFERLPLQCLPGPPPPPREPCLAPPSAR